MTTMTTTAADIGFRASPRASLLLRLTSLLATWSERAYERRMLGGLDERSVMDLGRGRAEIMAEAGKPFWRG
jgi:uncharacterized protein YjiS (DUF1127 family)